MKIKKYVAGILAAGMLTSFASLAQAASFTTEMHDGPFFSLILLDTLEAS